MADRPYGFRAYYADDVEPPKEPGGLAIEVCHSTEHGARQEAEIAMKRPDIGWVTVFGMGEF